MNKKTIFFYSLGAFGKNVMYAMSSVLQVFYTAFLGINPLFIGMMLLMKERSSGRIIKAKFPNFKRKSVKKMNEGKGN